MPTQSRTPNGVVSIECPSCLGVPVLVTARRRPPCSYCGADPCECAAADAAIERRLEDAHFDLGPDDGWEWSS